MKKVRCLSALLVMLAILAGYTPATQATFAQTPATQTENWWEHGALPSVATSASQGGGESVQICDRSAQGWISGDRVEIEISSTDIAKLGLYVHQSDRLMAGANVYVLANSGHSAYALQGTYNDFVRFYPNLPAAATGPFTLTGRLEFDIEDGPVRAHIVGEDQAGMFDCWQNLPATSSLQPLPNCPGLLGGPGYQIIRNEHESPRSNTTNYYYSLRIESLPDGGRQEQKLFYLQSDGLEETSASAYYGQIERGEYNGFQEVTASWPTTATLEFYVSGYVLDVQPTPARTVHLVYQIDPDLPWRDCYVTFGYNPKYVYLPSIMKPLR